VAIDEGTLLVYVKVLEGVQQGNAIVFLSRAPSARKDDTSLFGSLFTPGGLMNLFNAL
jgi:hypothetical protein